jgi:GTP cyclohydrolase II
LVTEQIPIESTPNPHNENYLRTKVERLGHTIGTDLDAPRSFDVG